jgi:hypothetical protein
VLPSLKPSTYNLTFSAAGFASSTQNGVTLLADQTATVNVTLKIGQAAETVTVSADMPQVNTTTATMSEVVEQRRVVELPLNGRNGASLLLVVAGAMSAPASGVDQGNTKTFPAAVTVSTNGSRQNQNHSPVPRCAPGPKLYNGKDRTFLGLRKNFHPRLRRVQRQPGEHIQPVHSGRLPRIPPSDRQLGPCDGKTSLRGGADIFYDSIQKRNHQ